MAQGGGNIVAQGGGNIVAQGGGNIISFNGAGIVAQGGGNAIGAGPGVLQAGIVGAAVTVLGIVPCPLCLEQRYAYYLAVPLGLAVAFAAARGAPRGVVVAGLAILALAALANAGLGAYHAGVEWGFWPGPADCTGPMLDLGKGGSLLDGLDDVKVVRCDAVQWRFLGLSLAGYNVLISLLMAAIAAWGLVRPRRRV